MTPPLDLDSLRRQYPAMPGWGERVFIDLHDIKESIKVMKAPDWTAKDISIVMGSMVAVIAALKGTGAV